MTTVTVSVGDMIYTSESSVAEFFFFLNGAEAFVPTFAGTFLSTVAEMCGREMAHRRPFAWTTFSRLLPGRQSPQGG